MALTKKDIQLIKSMFTDVNLKIERVDSGLQEKIEVSTNEIKLSLRKEIIASKHEVIKEITTGVVSETRTDFTATISALQIYLNTEFRTIHTQFVQTDRGIHNLVKELNGIVGNHEKRIRSLEDRE